VLLIHYVPKSKLCSPSRHPTLDDDFFSIDAFNRLTENSERNNGSLGQASGSGSKDGESLEDDVDLFKSESREPRRAEKNSQ